MNSSKLAQLASGLLFLSFSIKSLIKGLDIQTVCILLILGCIYCLIEYIETKQEMKQLQNALLKLEEAHVKDKIETLEKVGQLNEHLSALKVREGFKPVRF